ncbi:hypothetical protein [Prosthecobacter sp.]|uniref:hypothetical protein n=1 Tax=Prosthecobacter sp. TaxID=1965333 RepID=UPI00378491D4
MHSLNLSVIARLLLVGFTLVVAACSSCVVPAAVRQKAQTFSVQTVNGFPSASHVSYLGRSQQWANAFGPLGMVVGGVSAMKPEAKLFSAMQALKPGPASLIEDQVAHELSAIGMRRVASGEDVVVRIGSAYDRIMFSEAAPGTGKSGFQMVMQLTVVFVDRSGREVWRGRTGGVSIVPWPSLQEMLTSPATLQRMTREAAAWSGKRLAGVSPSNISAILLQERAAH